MLQFQQIEIEKIAYFSIKKFKIIKTLFKMIPVEHILLFLLACNLQKLNELKKKVARYLVFAI